MKLDIIIVTYNSEKWLDKLILSIENQRNIDLNDLNLYFVDNVSKDNTIKVLKSKKENSKIKNFNIIENKKNLGFGKANNYGAKNGKSEYIFFLNPDIELEEDCIFNIFKYIKESKEDVGMWECRQKPYEHPKDYNPITLETSWASGACIILRRDLFEKTNGFDEKIFMYAEDVDLSWHVRMYRYKIKYLPKAVVVHYCYESSGQVKPTQYLNSIINNLNLRRKYGTLRQKIAWYKHFFKVLIRKGPFKGSRVSLIKYYIKNLRFIFYFNFWRFSKKRNIFLKEFKPNFYFFDYEIVRNGDFEKLYLQNETNSKPLVSIIMRTCGRPCVLRQTLNCLKNQTYSNFEIIIAEDGKNISEKMIKEEFKDLNIKYFCTEEKVGRCKTGNLALQKAVGKYFNFLDDDDLFYPDHIEVLVNKLEKNPDYNAAYTTSFESKINIISREDKYEYEEIQKVRTLERKFSRLILLRQNLFPIQSVMFNKSIYEKLGGFNLELDNLEDWELWARYAMNNKFLYIPKTTSIYHVPAKESNYSKRQEELDNYYKLAQGEILKNYINISAKDLLEEYLNL